ncbi:hypothetical protein HYY74_01995 [Candidatus Woesearchaeota archaeon]|nr:hypothetical protein [Candidatus Woesearchaeota archaeon]
MVREFRFYLTKGDVRKQKPDRNLALAVLRDSMERLALCRSISDKAKHKYVLENAYDAMREAADSLLYLDGYKSYSHEASISYLMGKGFSESDILELDRFRKIRNGIKYYGGDCDEPDAKSAMKLSERIIERISKLLAN